MDYDPRQIWLSDHFRLSDFLGNHSVYARGVRNSPDSLTDRQYKNGEALCEYALEPLMAAMGPLSISYGLISAEFSRATVRYQDPNAPSHHRWDLGAAADVVCHMWDAGAPRTKPDFYEDARHPVIDSPALLAHTIDRHLFLPYSRLITYSESSFLCVAVSEEEVANGTPRQAFYENQYTGVSRGKPEYIRMASAPARARRLRDLLQFGMDPDWRGAGHPTYHGGGIRQYQHTRVSRYTTLLDWVFSLKSISNGEANCPNLASDAVQDSLAAAGTVYDHLVDQTGIDRMSVLSGFVAPQHSDFSADNDWRTGLIYVELGAPKRISPPQLREQISSILPAAFSLETTDEGAGIWIPVEDVLSGILEGR